MYSTLTRYGQSCATTNQHFPCPTLPLPTYHIDDQNVVSPPPPQSPSIPTRTRIQFEMTPTIITPSSSSSIKNNNDDLLPVMDPRFNLREICKQCILLEDHLTHDDKRCTDCCAKHFLALEALAEEALTLDKQGLLHDNAKILPKRIRHLQKLWIDNPTSDMCATISQDLREIRKQFQENVFDVIKNGCANGQCRVQL